MEQAADRHPLWLKFAGVFVTIALPVLFIMVNVRLVMSPAFLSFEYNRPDFPAVRLHASDLPERS